MNILIAEKNFNKSAKRTLMPFGSVVEMRNFKHFLKELPRADILITGLEVKLTAETLARARNLKLIGSRTTQLRYMDIQECRRRGISVVNIKADSAVLKRTHSTAEETFALIFALLRKIPWAFDSIKNGKWERMKFGGNELEGKTIGLIGFGRIGKLIARYSRAFGMKILSYDPFVAAGTMRKFGAISTDLDFLLKNSDIVSLHAVYDDSTIGMMKKSHFGKMKLSAVFVNTSRGEITDENALLWALKTKRIAGAALDTLAGERPDGGHLKNNPLVAYAKSHDNLIIVPHLGGATAEATARTQVYISGLVAKELGKL